MLVTCPQARDLLTVEAFRSDLRAAFGRGCAVVHCARVADADALLAAPRGRPGQLMQELRQVGVQDPVVVFDEIHRLGDRDTRAALQELFAPEGRAAFRDWFRARGR